jgi:hypothetical protein
MKMSYVTSTVSASPSLRHILESACEEHQASLNEFTVLSAEVDPYRIDTAAGHRDGQWLAEQLAKTYGPAQRAHWRGLHYAIVSAGDTKKPNGETYRNTEDDWQWLITNPAKAARWLGYVPFDRIVDQRNAAPIIHRKARVTPAAYLSIGIDVDIPDVADLEPTPGARGFIPRQAFHFAIFGEKSSLEDAVKPIAEEFEADLYLPTGEISDTLVYQMRPPTAGRWCCSHCPIAIRPGTRCPSPSPASSRPSPICSSRLSLSRW